MKKLLLTASFALGLTAAGYGEAKAQDLPDGAVHAMKDQNGTWHYTDTNGIYRGSGSRGLAVAGRQAAAATAGQNAPRFKPPAHTAWDGSRFVPAEGSPYSEGERAHMSR